MIETTVSFIISKRSSDFTNLKEMMSDTLTRKTGRWYKVVNRYREDLHLTWEEFNSMDRDTLKKVVRIHDNEQWEIGMTRSKVLRTYKLEKKAIGYELGYRNTFDSKLYARARINALQLEEHKGRGNQEYDTKCKLCQEEIEDITHFTIKFKKTGK